MRQNIQIFNRPVRIAHALFLKITKRFEVTVKFEELVLGKKTEL
jgi:hypothetical protein